MNVLMIYNQQRSVQGGEEMVVGRTVDLLRARGVEVTLALKSSRGTEGSVSRKIAAALGGAFNPFSYREAVRLIRDVRPDVVHAHNVFPNWSPAVFAAARACGVPSVYSVHSQILTCPTWYHLRNGGICERCLGGKEHWCVLTNCRGSLIESTVYAARSAAVRIGRLVRDTVTQFVVMSEFQRRQLIRGGFPADRIAVVPNMVTAPETAADAATGRYVAFVGRLSPEKGLDLFLEAARRMPDVPFKIAGDGPLAQTALKAASPNVELVGLLNSSELGSFYRNARMVVLPSRTYDTAPMVVLESLANGIPVVGASVGGIPETMDDGRAGLLVPPGDIEPLVTAIRSLWDDPERCRRIGLAGREVVSKRHSNDRHFDLLCAAYRKACERLAGTFSDCSKPYSSLGQP